MVPSSILKPNETLTYTLTGGNVGVGAAYNTIIEDTLPSNVTYIPGTLKIISSPDSAEIGPQTDPSGDDEAFVGVNNSKTFVEFYIGAGATDSSGGILQPGQTYSVSFEVLSPATQNQLSTVINTARITAQALSGDPYVDDATAIIEPDIPLPVLLSSFNARIENNNVILNWTMAGESQTGYFEVEQSSDGFYFSTIGSVLGNNSPALTNTYQFVGNLANNAASVLYYRLRMVDLNQNVTYSDIIALQTDGNAFGGVIVYPNPFVNSINLQVQSENDAGAVIKILNPGGQVLFMRNVYLLAGENIIVLNNLDNLPGGMLILEIITDGKVMQQKIIKQ